MNSIVERGDWSRGLRTDPGLLVLLKQAAERGVTPQQAHEQRIGVVAAECGVSRELVERAIGRGVGPIFELIGDVLEQLVAYRESARNGAPQSELLDAAIQGLSGALVAPEPTMRGRPT